ncbi:uncharacterized protein LOC127008070 [Eriocheir sinensis]|uniref:uncharacterized protein LOC127008070 n=1 Tax=Eriocheir sinensis TaxID=95602 RepID=UPI0021C94022|nr:uncharacterized protein LOC127008070 [Eriocheir sinensis]XP_050735573.1 uncharacterized protein LOC127008070 [Eriocheir sinensis]
MSPPVACLLLLLVASLMGGVMGHGRLMDPPARNAMWRLGYPNPVNYNDNELYCGGFVVHYQKNGGKCGVCGDDYRHPEPRDHEAGGAYGNGIVTKRYVAGQVIDIEAELTTNHWGYMEIRLCPHNEPHLIITQACLDQHVLPMENTIETKFVIPKESKKSEIFRWRVKLPDGITCTNCVLQWKYFAGNTWGVDETSGSGAVGYGPQETFINCADITINTNVPTGAVVDNPWQLYFRGSFPGVMSSTSSNNGLTPLVVRTQLCIPVDHFARDPAMHEWCMRNCLKYPPNCDPNYCRCVHECEAVGEFKLQKFADHYCHQECLGYPSNCDPKRCRCF